MDLKKFEMTQGNIVDTFDRSFCGSYYQESDKPKEEKQVVPILNLLLPAYRMAEANGLDEITALKFCCVYLQEELNRHQQLLMDK